LIFATTSNWFLIGPIANLLGHVMNAIFEVLDLIGIPNIGLAIIFFTLIVKACMIPLSISQQKYSKLQAVMNPEIQAIQKKYKGKTDQASLMAQNQETKDVYAKYGTSATGGCLNLLIQMPILFALYQVIYKMPGYITKLKGLYDGVATALQNIEGFADVEAFQTLAKANSITDLSVLAGENAHEYVIDFLYNLSGKEWDQLFTIFNNDALKTAYTSVADSINSVNSFLGFDLAGTPWDQMLAGTWWIVLIPLLSGALQFLSTKLMPQTNNNTSTDNQSDTMGALSSSMKTMNYMFPLMSIVFCFMFSAGLGVYWVASSGVQVLVQLFVNNYINKVDINDMVQKNIEKLNAKRAKKGLPPKKFQKITTIASSIEEEQKAEENLKKSLQEKANVSTEYYQSHSTARKGSLAEKAGMVLQYDERMKEQKSGKKKQGDNDGK